MDTGVAKGHCGGSGLTRASSLCPGLLGGCSLSPSSLAHFSLFLLYLSSPSTQGPTLTFEVVSLVPYSRNLISVSLLSSEQVARASPQALSISPALKPVTAFSWPWPSLASVPLPPKTLCPFPHFGRVHTSGIYRLTLGIPPLIT